MYSIEGKKVHDFWPLLDLATTFFLLQVLYIRVGHTFKESNGKRKKRKIEISVDFHEGILFTDDFDL